jgi:geranylgeranyl diphosphate synthase type I
VVGPAHRAAVDRLTPEIRHIAGYHAGWWDADGNPRASTGKALRPAIVLASARAARPAAGNPRPAAAEVACAVAVELVHDFSLLHDDVMDGDTVRRHQAAAWTVFGVGRAVLAGDALLALALDVLAGATGPAAVAELTGALLELCAGQSDDLRFEERRIVSLAECMHMAEGKTGALFGAACALGALAAGAAGSRVTALREFGRHLGLAFQLADDRLGIWGDPAVTGKPARADLARRKKTLPVIAALESGTPVADVLARFYEPGRELTGMDVIAMAKTLESAGAGEWAQRQADIQVAAALGCLDRAGINTAATEGLRALALLAASRDL